jgi:hypothetical protein
MREIRPSGSGEGRFHPVPISSTVERLARHGLSNSAQSAYPFLNLPYLRIRPEKLVPFVTVFTIEDKPDEY